MAGPHDEFTNHCVELLSPLGLVRTRRMFGGVGFYLDDVFIALIAYGRLYLKVDAQTRPQFEAAGCEPFVFDTSEKSVAMSYLSAPEEAMESPPLMQNWARLALAAALRARAAKPPSAPRKAAAVAPAKPAKPRKTAAKVATKKAGGRAG
ncbi:MAG: competence protein TfoX [Methylibium sp. NZG]|nr:MAG: competence protein TfoX [Methylibium sp. NZG]